MNVYITFLLINPFFCVLFSRRKLSARSLSLPRPNRREILAATPSKLKVGFILISQGVTGRKVSSTVQNLLYKLTEIQLLLFHIPYIQLLLFHFPDKQLLRINFSEIQLLLINFPEIQLLLIHFPDIQLLLIHFPDIQLLIFHIPEI